MEKGSKANFAINFKENPEYEGSKPSGTGAMKAEISGNFYISTEVEVIHKRKEIISKSQRKLERALKL